MKGQGIYAFCSLHEGTEYKDSLKKELVQVVREQIGGPSPRLALLLAAMVPALAAGQCRHRACCRAQLSCLPRASTVSAQP